MSITTIEPDRPVVPGIARILLDAEIPGTSWHDIGDEYRAELFHEAAGLASAGSVDAIARDLHQRTSATPWHEASLHVQVRHQRVAHRIWRVQHG